jgi:hypothetical protein
MKQYVKASKWHAKKISAFCATKKATWTKLIDVLSRRMALRTHNLSPTRLKNDFDDVDEARFQGVQRPCEPISCILCIEKIDLDKVA